MYIRPYNPLLQLLKYVRNLSTTSSTILKPYPSYVERQVEVPINTASSDEYIEIDQETNVKVAKPTATIRANINYIDTNPLGDKKQPIVLLVHGYPGTHESTKTLIEEFQRRNFRCIAPDMPYCGKTTLPLWSGMLWKNSLFLRARFLGELLKTIMHDKLTPIHAVVGMHENAYTLMSLTDQYTYFHCSSMILVNPTPRKLIRFLPLAKFAFDFGRIPLHWPVAKFLLKTLGYKELLTYSQKDIMAALRMWMLEDTHQYDAYIHNLWLSRLRTMLIVSNEDKHLNTKILDALVKDLSVETFSKSTMANCVIKNYACDHNELLTDRISYVVDDIETFISMTLKSPSATIRQSDAAARRIKAESKKKLIEKTSNNEQDDQLDETSYKRASANDFFSKAFGPTQTELKPNQPHSIRSAFETFAGDFIQKPPPGVKRETLANVKEEMRKKKVRIDTKN